MFLPFIYFYYGGAVKVFKDPMEYYIYNSFYVDKLNYVGQIVGSKAFCTIPENWYSKSTKFSLK